MRFKNLYYGLFLILSQLLFSQDKQLVSDISFEGNDNVSSAELRSILLLKLPVFFVRDEFTPKKLNRDKIGLIAFYKSKGYLEVQVDSKITNISDEYVAIQFIIKEGNPYTLKTVKYFGNKQLSDEDIAAFLQLSVNNHYNPVHFKNQLKELKRVYLRRGKLNISIMDEVTVDGLNIHSRINISEGITYFIDSVYVTGLELVGEKYINREIVFSPGERYNIDKIDESKRRIFDSGMFSSIEIIPRVGVDKPGKVDIEIKVREYKSSSIEANFGFRELSAFQDNLSTTGVDAQGRWILGNIFNTSSNIEITGRIASDINLNLINDNPLVERDFSIVYRTPWTLVFRLPSRVKYFYIQESENHNLIRNGITYSLHFEPSRNTRYEINSTLEVLRSSDTLFTTEHTEPSRWINLRYLSNQIQNPLAPTGGDYKSLSATLYGTILGGERHFFKFESEYRKFINISSGVIAFRTALGYIYNLDESYELPAGYRFRLGGQTSLRGWSKPEDFENPNGDLISNMVNLEFRFPIREKIGGELFFDAGRLYNTPDKFLSTSLSWDIGFGMIYNATLGPVRIDIGFPYGDLNMPQPHASLLYMF